MRKLILLTEYNRLREILEPLDRFCPVCPASERLKPRFVATNCVANAYMTACHPTVQARCMNTIKLSDRLKDTIENALVEIEEELIFNFKMNGRTLRIQHKEWLKRREEDCD